MDTEENFLKALNTFVHQSSTHNISLPAAGTLYWSPERGWKDKNCISLSHGIKGSIFNRSRILVFIIYKRKLKSPKQLEVTPCSTKYLCVSWPLANPYDPSPGLNNHGEAPAHSDWHITQNYDNSRNKSKAEKETIHLQNKSCSFLNLLAVVLRPNFDFQSTCIPGLPITFSSIPTTQASS